MMCRASCSIGIHVPREMCSKPTMLISFGSIPSSPPSFQCSQNLFGSRSPSCHMRQPRRFVVHMSKTSKNYKKRYKKGVDWYRLFFYSPDTDDGPPALRALLSGT